MNAYRGSADRHALLLIAALVLIWLAALVFGGHSSRHDLTAFSLIYSESDTLLVGLASYVTWLGDWLVLVPLALGSGIFLVWRNHRFEAAALIVSVVLVRLLVVLQKEWFDRARPDVEQWAIVHSDAFPSNHAASSAVTYISIAALLSGSRVAVLAAVLLTLVIGISRVLLGVHWPSDVVGGWAFGSMGAIVCVFAVRKSAQFRDGFTVS